MNDTKYLFIEGNWQSGDGKSRTLINPYNEERILEIKEATEEQASQAVLAARRAFDETDWAINKEKRISLIHRLADLLEENSEEFAVAETTNTGKPIRESRLDISDSAACLRYYADLVREETGSEKKNPDDTISKVIEEPIGVCALIVPWNFPLLLGMWKIAPALAAGNTVVFKPSELTALSAIKFTKLIEQSGFPPGVFNLVLGEGLPVGETLVKHPETDKISFTGGSKTGQAINQLCAGTFKRVSLELGGKSPLIIREDADLDAAVEWGIFGAFFNQGEVCVASSRILIHQNIYDSFIERLTKKLEIIKIGDPLQEETEMGPVISKDHLDKIEQYIDVGQQEGATLLTGGRRLAESGFYLSPAVFTNVNQSMRIVQEEIFGPVVTVQSFESDEEAVKLANGTKYGLAAGILSADVRKAEEIASKLKAGTIWINSYHTPYVDAPWGGYKQSGIGRELGPHGLAGFREVKHINTSGILQRADWYNF
ncbi:aldehyde dehydrogenase family protein [Pseudalkalibacillus caeni]|uniref:Aldehyde dehydrogenase family protein n=1 Tax=Exobacillus caeni TaxID=2574798 RepID=A0A5R9FAG8_9BACL|nr:aldehyde dehydrogenase family protein [Pseudalkalibacillus caeni]TLS38658.1 aldehyde dehydrogenase family protein [Pseudalkalibacillus caeni]